MQFTGSLKNRNWKPPQHKNHAPKQNFSLKKIKRCYTSPQQTETFIDNNVGINFFYHLEFLNTVSKQIFLIYENII